MSAINSISFDQASYTQGATITVTIDYTPDTPSVVPQTNTLTATITNSGGTVTAQTTADFTVNVPNPGGDTVQVSDTGNRTWTEGATTPDQTVSGNLDVVFTATA